MRILSRTEDTLTLLVGTVPEQQVTLGANGSADCTCGGMGANGCVHIVAAQCKTEDDGSLRKLRQEQKMALGREMLKALTRSMPDGESVRLMAVIRLLKDGRTGLGLQVGQERMYAVKNIAEFISCYEQGASLELSSKFTYRPAQMRFSKEEEAVIVLLQSHMPPKRDDDLEPAVKPESDGRFIILTGAFLQSVMRFFERRPFYLMLDGERRLQSHIRTMELPLFFNVAMDGGLLTVSAQGAESIRMLTQDGRYVFDDGQIKRLHSAQARVCKLLCEKGHRFTYPAEEAEETLSVLLPSLSIVGEVLPSPEFRELLVNQPLKPQVYVDLVRGNVEARVELHYGDTVIHLFQTDTQQPSMGNGKMLLRDGRAETELLDFFSDMGFVVREGRIVLRRAKDILTFCTQGVVELGKLAEVFVSDAFRKMKPRRFSGTASFRMQGGRLLFSLLEGTEPVTELIPVLKAIEARQQYIRLKSGEFLDIRDMTALAPVAQELLEAAALDDPQAEPDVRELNFGAYRAAYMVTMLKMAGGATQTTEDVNNTARAFFGAVRGRRKRYSRTAQAQARGVSETRLGVDTVAVRGAYGRYSGR